jgi:2-succinyl-6-hydroxy-2,4-cyclohexadiene-1-carboxylate synthase
MKIKFPGFSINAEILRPGKSSKYIFMLHGFTGSLNDFRNISERINPEYTIAGIDILGHGKSDSPEDTSLYSASDTSAQLQRVINEFTSEKIILAGYSMGGRAAVSFAVNYPSLLNGLILESCNPGIEDAHERELRVMQDSKIISILESSSMEEFTGFWMNLDIFSSQKKLPVEIQEAIKNAKLKNNKTGLINSLKGFGTGIMPSYLKELRNINIPTLIISGDLDKKYSSICAKMAGRIPVCKHINIPGAGHNTHLEQPEQYITAVNEYLSGF